MANIIRTNGNHKIKEYIFKDGVFSILPAVQHSSNKIENDIYKVHGSFSIPFTDILKTVFIKFSVGSGVTNFKVVFDGETTYSENSKNLQVYAYGGVTARNKDFIIASQGNKNIGITVQSPNSSFISVKEIWSENIGGGGHRPLLKIIRSLIFKKRGDR